MNDHIDQTHRDCMAARRWVNNMFQEARDKVAAWEPRPAPASSRRPRRTPSPDIRVRIPVRGQV